MSKAKAAAAATVATNAAAAAAVDDQKLPQREAELFKQCAKFYEAKKYDKAIKSANAVLQNFPNNGEALVMKGLSIFHSENKEEGTALVKQGLNKNLKSSICWHVYGLVHRANADYVQAIKCYQTALRFDSDNTQIAGDLAILQAQSHQFDGLADTRKHILKQKSSARNNWVACAVAVQMSGHVKKAIEILDSYDKILSEEKKKEESYERTEFEMYKLEMLYEVGEFDTAVKFMATFGDRVRDLQRFTELKANIMLQQGKLEDARAVFLELLHRNPDNYAYHMGYRESFKLNPLFVHPKPLTLEFPFHVNSAGLKSSDFTPEQVIGLQDVYQNLSQLFPKSNAVYRLPLDFLTGAAFEKAVDTYLKERLRKGIPSLFPDVRALYNDPTKKDVIAALVQRYAEELKHSSRFSAEADAPTESPSCFLMVMYFLGQHYDFVGEREAALRVVDEAIAHTPTTMDLYMLKARILKHAGDDENAFDFMDYARSLDLADRYLNTKCVRYAFRNLNPDLAEKLVLLFIREGKPSAIWDLQVMWYELAAGNCFFRMGKLAQALKMFSRVREHFDEVYEDQMDFHSYAFRKSGTRAYVKMLKFMASVRSQKFFGRAAKGAIKTLLQLHAKPLPALTPEELAKSIADARESAKHKKKRADKPDDTDPNGVLMARTKDPIGEAYKWAEPLLKHHTADAEALRLGMHVCLLQGSKVKKAFEALKASIALGVSHPDVHISIVQFFSAWISSQSAVVTEDMRNAVAASVGVEPTALTTVDGLSAFNDKFVAEHKGHYDCLVAAAKASHIIRPSDSQSPTKLLFEMTSVGPTSWKICVDALLFLTDTLGNAEAAAKYKEECNKRMPLCRHFMNDSQLQLLKENIAEREKLRARPDTVTNS